VDAATLQPAKPAASPSGKLGTFAGVFTPSIMTILGLVLFLRVGYVVGELGLLMALLIILLANGITILTSFSVAAIATNLRVKGGGDYYLISRTLGLGFGGAIGIVLFFAQSVSIGFYCIGFAEAVISIFHLDHDTWIRVVAAPAALGLFALAWLGADWATRFQYVVMALIAIALLAFAVGALDVWSEATLAANLVERDEGLPFWAAFAIFFPAVTGFTQGVSMSGDLRDPGRSLPTGTFAAVGVSLMIYLAVAVLFAASVPPPVLRENFSAMKTVALYAPLIDAGVIAATLSSALASFLGAPRILQSLAQDRIFTVLNPFARGHGPTNNPRRGVILSAVIAVAVIAIGSLNLIAPIVSMFFLVSYGLINYATYYEARAASPSFRPSLRWYDLRLSLAGGLGCVIFMIAIDWQMSLVAGAVIFAIFWYLKRRAVRARWADSQRSYHLTQARDHLIAAYGEVEHPRDWRPMLLVFSDDPHRRARLLRFTSWIEGGSGVSTLVRFLEGHGPGMLERRRKAAEELAKELRARGSNAFPLVIATSDLDAAISAVVQSAGVGPLRVNTVLINWFEGTPKLGDTATRGHYSQNLRMAFRLGCNLLVLDAEAAEWETLDAVPAADRVIDLWWSESATGQLMLLLAHLITRDDSWRGAKIRVLVPAPAGELGAHIEKIRTMLQEVRIAAEPIAVSDHGVEALVERSRSSSIVFIPFSLRAGRFFHAFGGEIDDMLPHLPIVVLTMAAENVELDADPDEGAQRARALAADRLAVATRMVEKAEQEAAAATKAADDAEAALFALVRAGADAEALAAKRAESIEAHRAARQAARKAARALAIKESAEARARDTGVEIPETARHAAAPEKDGRKNADDSRR
jgi:amino acid transporter